MTKKQTQGLGPNQHRKALEEIGIKVDGKQ
jgi:hypothetical protein